MAHLEAFFQLWHGQSMPRMFAGGQRKRSLGPDGAFQMHVELAFRGIFKSVKIHIIQRLGNRIAEGMETRLPLITESCLRVVNRAVPNNR